jgi:hypothetical protein
LELSENHFFLLGKSVPLSVVAVETVECVEAASEDMALEELLEEVKLDILDGVLVMVVIVVVDLSGWSSRVRVDVDDSVKVKGSQDEECFLSFG